VRGKKDWLKILKKLREYFQGFFDLDDFAGKSWNFSACRAIPFHSICRLHRGNDVPCRSPVWTAKQLHNYITHEFAWFFSKHGTFIIAPLPASVPHVERLISIFLSQRERESLLNAPSCTRNTCRYETNDTTTPINSDECVYSHSFPRAHKYTPAGRPDRSPRYYAHINSNKLL